jgi:hypothetical protein
MSEVNTAIGLAGVHETLLALEPGKRHSYQALSDLMEALGVREPEVALETLVSSNLLYDSPQGVEITAYGRKTSLLLQAINGTDLHEIWRQLTELDPELQNYDLIPNKLCEEFLNSLVTQPGFGRLYLCSPWISLDRRREGLLANAILQAEQRGQRPEILVVTRPERGTDVIPPSGQFLQQLGSTVYLNRKLHSKLYIREPDQNGGYLMAILGSQNLTKSRYLELGIRVHSDTTMIQNLIRYFLDLASHSDEA